MKIAVYLAVLALFMCFASAANSPPIFINVENGDSFELTEHQLFTFYVLGTDDEANYPLEFTFGEQVGNLTSFNFSAFNSTSGIINFTPGYTEIGLTNIQLIVKDSLKFASVATVYFTVNNTNDPPEITSYEPVATTLELYEGQNYTFDFLATDPDIPYHDVLENFWFLDDTVNSTNRSWTYSLGYCENSNATVLLWVNDTGGKNDSVQWNVTEIYNTNREPEFNASNSIPNLTWEEDNNLLNNFSLIPLHFDDLDFYCEKRADSPNFSVSGNYNVSVNISGDAPYNVSFYPDKDFFGINHVTIILSDGNATVASNSFILNVTSVPDYPKIYPIPDQEVYAYAEFAYLINASDPENYPMTFTANTSLFTIPASGLINFTPEFEDAGVHDINITVIDFDGLKNSTTMKLTVYPNHAPHIEPISDQAIGLDEVLHLNVTGGDEDDDAINFTIFNDSFVRDWFNETNAVFTFVPITNGSMNVTVFAFDPYLAYNSTSFMLNISYFNFPPVIEEIPSPQIAKVGKLYSYNVVANDGNFGYEELTYFDNASFFNIGDDGSIMFTPTIEQEGNYSVNITVCDNGMPPKCSMINVDYILTQNHPPVFEPVGNYTVYEDENFSLQINASDPEGDEFNFSDNSTLFNISFSGLINFTPWDAVSGFNYSINISATDIDNATSYIVFTLEVIRTNEPPYFDPHLWEIEEFNHTAQGNRSLIYINVSDEERDNITFAMEFLLGTPFFNITVLNESAGRAFLDFTPANSEVGNYTIQINISDGQNMSRENVTFEIINVNDPPKIDMIYPTGRDVSAYTLFEWSNASDPLYQNSSAVINISEGTWVLFNQTSFDIDEDPLNFTWLLDHSVVSRVSSLEYYFDFDSQRESDMELRVEDGSVDYDFFIWHIQIMDINREPTFGWRYDFEYSNLSNGAFNNTVIENTGAIHLDEIGGNYSGSGTYVSRAIDFFAQSKMQLLQFLSSFTVPNGTVLKISTATSTNTISFTNWTTGVTLDNFTIRSANKRYLKYKLYFETNNGTDTPVFYGANITYRIPPTTIKNNNVYVSYYDLDDYFYDLDPDDVLNYSFSGAQHMTLLIDNNGIVRIEPEAGYTGIDTVTFYANDSLGVAASNEITFTIEPGPGSGTSSSSSSTNTKIVIQTQIEKEKEMQYSMFDLLSPQEATVYANETVMVPIRLVNNGNDTLNDISLNATSENKGINFSFSKSKFPVMLPNAVENTTLFASPYKIAGTYEILVNAYVKTPEINDSVKILINSREKGEHNSTQINTKIAFTQDLLSSNPECLELNELLIEAKNALNANSFGKAEAIIDKVISDCKYLSLQKNLTTEKAGSISQSLFDRIRLGKSSVLIGVIAFSVIMLFGLFLLYKKT